MAKCLTSLRLSPDGKALSIALSKRLGIPKTAVYEMAIRLLARQENITLQTPKAEA